MGKKCTLPHKKSVFHCLIADTGAVYDSLRVSIRVGSFQESCPFRLVVMFPEEIPESFVADFQIILPIFQDGGNEPFILEWGKVRF